MKKLFFLLAGVSILGLWYYSSTRSIVQYEEVKPYLHATNYNLDKSQLIDQLEFWTKRLDQQPLNNVYQQRLASLQAQYFRLAGEVDYLRQSNSLLLNLAERFPNSVSYWQNLARNAIAGHEFAKADFYANQALALGEKRYQSSLIKVDVLLERGNRQEARGLLNVLGSQYSFEYLTRQVKLQDQLGQLDEAIHWMERAVSRGKASGDSSLISWSLANLGDMYGHQGKIKKSYNTFLQALQYKPSELHALKGIAWIAFSHDKAPTLAKEIVEFLQSLQDIPDYDLLLADIATYQKEVQQAKVHNERFLDRASQAEYGFLYTRPLVQLQLDRGEMADPAIRTKAEIAQRAHPISYVLRAKFLHDLGARDAAIKMLEDKVLGQTEEPDALYVAGMICKENRKNKAAKVLLKAAKEAAFELGPIVTIEIENALRDL